MPTFSPMFRPPCFTWVQYSPFTYIWDENVRWGWFTMIQMIIWHVGSKFQLKNNFSYEKTSYVCLPYLLSYNNNWLGLSVKTHSYKSINLKINLALQIYERLYLKNERSLFSSSIKQFVTQTCFSKCCKNQEIKE